MQAGDSVCTVELFASHLQTLLQCGRRLIADPHMPHYARTCHVYHAVTTIGCQLPQSFSAQLNVSVGWSWLSH